MAKGKHQLVELLLAQKDNGHHGSNVPLFLIARTLTPQHKDLKTIDPRKIARGEKEDKKAIDNEYYILQKYDNCSEAAINFYNYANVRIGCLDHDRDVSSYDGKVCVPVTSPWASCQRYVAHYVKEINKQIKKENSKKGNKRKSDKKVIFVSN